MSNLTYVIDRIDAGAKVRFFMDYFGTEYIQLSRGWLPGRRITLSADQLDIVKRALRDRRRRRDEMHG